MDVHIYGVPDWLPHPRLDLVVHGGYGDTFRDHWFVVTRPGPAVAGPSGALLAEEVDPGHWRGFWTFDDDRVTAIEDAIERHL
ncbi:MAG: hypothetical protein ABEJ67_01230 [Halanaeroarchaeum sp.]